jgi:uncharacterized protein YbjT (DUF2867 family)
MTVLVMGATGHVGSEIVAGLRAAGRPVRALSRQSRDWPDGVEGVVADPMDPDGLAGLADGVTEAFVMSGYAGEARLLSELAEDAHVVLLSASSAELGAEGDSNPLAAMHLGSERAVLGSGRPYTFLRPCSFQSNASRWSEQLAAGDVVRAPFGDVPIAAIDPSDIAAVAVLVLTGDGHADASYRLSGPEALSPREQVAVLGAVLDRHLVFEPSDDDPAVADIFRGHPHLESDVQPTVPDLLGRPAGTFAGWVARNRQIFEN